MDLVESKAIMIPKSKLREQNPPVAWTNADSLALFTNDHRNKIMLRNLGNVGFSTFMNSIFYATVTTDETTMFLGHCCSLFAIPRSRYLSRRNLTKRTQRSDESVRAFTAELCKLIMYCDYPTAEVDERLKENLIINTYSTEICKKAFRLT